MHMIYLGIDIAKNSHVAAAMTSEGEIILTPFSFTNSAAGFALLKEGWTACQRCLYWLVWNPPPIMVKI